MGMAAYNSEIKEERENRKDRVREKERVKKRDSRENLNLNCIFEFP